MLSIPKRDWEQPSYAEAASRSTGREHRGGQRSSMGRGMTHSTFLRETFWLGRVAETVM